MALETAAYSAAVVFVAYLVRGVAGFGSGLIAVPLLTLISPITAVVPVVVSLDYIGSASQSVRNLDDIAWREQVMLSPSGSTSFCRRRSGRRAARVSRPRTAASSAGCSARCSAPAAPSTRSTCTRALDRTTFRTTFSLNFLIDGGVRLIAYAVMGLLSRETLLHIAAALPIAAAALFAGGRIQNSLSQRTFVPIIAMLVLGGGITLLLR